MFFYLKFYSMPLYVKEAPRVEISCDLRLAS